MASVSSNLANEMGFDHAVMFFGLFCIVETYDKEAARSVYKEAQQKVDKRPWFFLYTYSILMQHGHWECSRQASQLLYCAC